MAPNRLRSVAARPPKRRAILAVGILQCDLPLAKAEQVAPMHLHPGAVSASAGECPLRHTTVPAHQMTSIAPVCIRERRPHLRKCGAHSISAFEAGAADVRSS